MSNFKKYLLESEERETVNMVGLFSDIETFLSYGSNKKESQRKEQHANFIQKYVLRCEYPVINANVLKDLLL